MKTMLEPERVGILASLMLAAFCVCAGCSRSGLGKVSGTVTLDGEPLPDALVEFVPTGGDGGLSFGRTDSNGDYYLMLSRTAEGATPGEYKVRITTRDVVDDGGQERWIDEKVPSKYNSNTELLATVEPGSNTIDFDLSTTGGTVDQPMQYRSDH